MKVEEVEEGRVVDFERGYIYWSAGCAEHVETHEKV